MVHVFWKHCQGIINANRLLIRDIDAVKQQIDDDRSIEEIKECAISEKRNEILEFLANCSAGCPTPCFEESYVVDQSYIATETVENEIELSFTFKELQETHIIDVPSYSLSTFISNFGGVLGLMMGLSAISITEIIVFVMLYFVEKVYLVCMKLADHATITSVE